MLKKTIFVTLDGVDGVGKSLLVERLAESLRADGYLVQTTRQPGDTQLGLKIREILKSPDIFLSEEECLSLFLADRLAHNNYIHSLVEQNTLDFIICDRGVLSSLTYQRDAFKNLEGRTVATVCLLSLYSSLSGKIHFPNKCFVITASPEERLKRLAKVRQDAIERFDAKSQEEAERAQYFMTTSAWDAVLKMLPYLNSFDPSTVISNSLCVVGNENWTQFEQNIEIMKRELMEVLESDFE